MTTPIDVVVFKCRKICPTENRWNSALFTSWKTAAAFQTVATARIASKICQGQPKTMRSQCCRFHPNRFTFGGVTAERVNTVFCPVQYFHDLPEAMLRFRRIIALKMRRTFGKFRAFRTTVIRVMTSNVSNNVISQIWNSNLICHCHVIRILGRLLVRYDTIR